MFSLYHIIWIAVCFAMIAGCIVILTRRKPPLKKVVSVYLILGAISEIIKILSVIEIVPMVEPVIESGGGNSVINYVPTGEYTPVMGAEHLPLELCSLQIILIAVCCFVKSEKIRHIIYSIIYPTGLIGGTLGIALATVTAYIKTPEEYFLTPRIWQYFLYHAMIVILAVYLGISRESGLRFKDWKYAVAGTIALDLPTFYLNSVLSSQVYQNDHLIGVSHRINFFSSYVNPLGLILTEKWQWITYLVIRAVMAFMLIVLLFLPFRKRQNYKVI